LPRHSHTTSSSINGGCHHGNPAAAGSSAAAAAGPAASAAAKAAEITYGRLRVTTATRGCYCWSGNGPKALQTLFLLFTVIIPKALSIRNCW